MRRLIAIVIIVCAALTLTGDTAAADSGMFTAAGGESCTWYSFGSSMATVTCSGYSRSAGDFVNYTCDYSFYGSMASWNCRSIDGATWQGSR